MKKSIGIILRLITICMLFAIAGILYSTFGEISRTTQVHSGMLVASIMVGAFIIVSRLTLPLKPMEASFLLALTVSSPLGTIPFFSRVYLGVGRGDYAVNVTQVGVLTLIVSVMFFCLLYFFQPDIFISKKPNRKAAIALVALLILLFNIILPLMSADLFNSTRGLVVDLGAVLITGMTCGFLGYAHTIEAFKKTKWVIWSQRKI